MSNAGSRLLRSACNARAFVRGETTEGFVVHVLAGLDDTIAVCRERDQYNRWQH
jgi:hypothetical protein